LKRKIKYITTIFTLTILASSCGETTPASFWTNFHKGRILTKVSDQGPWGGHRVICWKSETNNTFTHSEVIDFAEKNEWKLVDSISFSADTLSENSFSRLKNDDYSREILNENVWPKLEPDDHKVFIFRTGWLAVQPGNSHETFENGYAVLNSDGTKLKIYHLWGE
jgi:hypothetical protein